ncbi:hypothetical protein Bpfe_006179 [Biomphalaria pfeifferi]|uniref:Fibrinogen C-terminal domain-containing protein n=1 Tax=Biomphalaria pfeifferi TaxID=112525 RepID=A0AAD8FHH1_BIOPF|nr:hypothetical protein Bpfe_006179 [Biomphalaria pfeifferi]
MHLLVWLLTISLCYLSTKGAVLKFVSVTPTLSNNNSCGLVTCEHTLQQGNLYVQEIRLYNVAQGGSSRLAIVEGENCDKGKHQSVSSIRQSFSRSGASVVVGVRGAAICNEGEFMCEVTYVNDQLEKLTDVVIVRANVRLPSVDGLCEAVSEVTSTLEALQNQLANLTQFAKSQNLCSTEVTYPEGKLVFRGTKSVRSSVYEAYRSGAGVPEIVDDGCKQVGKSMNCSNHYRNNEILNNWKGISNVTFAIYKDNVKVKQVVFNAAGSNYMSWYEKGRVLDSSWSDLKSATANYFSIVGHQDGGLRRTFFMNHYYSTCAVDVGWFVALDANQGGCEWEKNDGFPAFKYAAGDQRVNWNTAGVGVADYIAIFVK